MKIYEQDEGQDEVVGMPRPVQQPDAREKGNACQVNWVRTNRYGPVTARVAAWPRAERWPAKTTALEQCNASPAPIRPAPSHPGASVRTSRTLTPAGFFRYA